MKGRKITVNDKLLSKINSECAGFMRDILDEFEYPRYTEGQGMKQYRWYDHPPETWYEHETKTWDMLSELEMKLLNKVKEILTGENE